MAGNPLVLLLADDFFLLSHDERSGRPRQHPTAVALGLAGALLGELMLMERISTSPGGTVELLSYQPTADQLASTVLSALIGEQTHSVHTWLSYFARTSTLMVANRLERKGVVSRVESRRLLRKDILFIPNQGTSHAAWAATKLRHLLQGQKPMNFSDVVLAGLVEAAGLDQVVLWSVPPVAIEYRNYVVSTLSAPLRELIAQTKSTVGHAVLTNRG
jgi:hypothetical protein